MSIQLSLCAVSRGEFHLEDPGNCISKHDIFVSSWIAYELRLDSRLSRRFQTDSIIGHNDRNRHRQRRLEYGIASLTIPFQLNGTLNETTPALCPTEPYSPPFFDKNVSYKLKPRQLFNSHDFIHACVVARTILSHKTPDM